MLATKGMRFPIDVILVCIRWYAAFRKHKRALGYSWRMHETYIKVKGVWKYLYRAVDKEGKTPRVQRNAEEGVWSGILLSQMIEIFNNSQVQASIFGVPEVGQS